MLYCSKKCLKSHNSIILTIKLYRLQHNRTLQNNEQKVTDKIEVIFLNRIRFLSYSFFL